MHDKPYVLQPRISGAQVLGKIINAVLLMYSNLFHRIIHMDNIYMKELLSLKIHYKAMFVMFN